MLMMQSACGGCSVLKCTRVYYSDADDAECLWCPPLRPSCATLFRSLLLSGEQQHTQQQQHMSSALCRRECGSYAGVGSCSPAQPWMTRWDSTIAR
jgi:hypothetical protein